MYKIASPLTVAIFLVCGAARADDKPLAVVPDSAAAQAAECQEGSEGCKLECKRFAPPTGTRLGGHIECRTRQYWQDRMREDQATTVKIQENSYKFATPGGG